MANTSLRWGRIVLGGILAEMLLMIAVVVVQAAGGGEDAVTITAVVGSFVAFVPVAWWLGRRLPQPLLHGVVMGAFADVVYTVLFVIGRMFNPTIPAMPLLYYVAHVMKLAGGAVGGWLVQRSAGMAGSPARVG